MTLLDLSQGGTRSDGGTGSDTLRFNGAGKSLDLTALSDERVAGLEVVDLTGTGNNKIVLSVEDLIALSDSASARIDGNAGDVAALVGPGWSAGVDANIGSNTYHVFSNAGATLLVDLDITTTIV